MFTLYFIAGLGGSAAVSIGAGVIGDLFSTKDRALAMSIYTLGPLIGPSVGPIAGGFITQTIGFKWNFIVIAIFAGCSQALGMFCLEESYAPVIRIRRAQREIKETGRKTIEHDILLEQHQDFRHVLWTNMSRPFSLLFGSFIVFILSFYMAL